MCKIRATNETNAGILQTTQKFSLGGSGFIMTAKKRTHIVTEKVPILVALVFMLGGFLIPALLGQFVGNLIGMDSLAGRNVMRIIGIALSLLMLFLFKMWFQPEYEGSIKMEGLAYGMKLYVPIIVFWVIWYIFRIVAEGDMYEFSAEALFEGLRAGVTEEIAFRGLAAAVLFRQFRKGNSILIPPLFAGIVFGGVHLVNLTAGEPIGLVLPTVAFAIGFGSVFGLNYALCGNVIPSMIIHSAYDAFVFMGVDDGGSSEIGWVNYVEIGMMLAFAIFYLILLIRNKDKTIALWNRKWGGDTGEAVQKTNLE